MFSIFVIPLIISAIPLLIMVGIYKFQKEINSYLLILGFSLLTLFIGFVTPFYAIIFCANALAQNMPNDKPKCVTGASVFLLVGFTFTFITFILAIVCCINSYKKSESLK